MFELKFMQHTIFEWLLFVLIFCAVFSILLWLKRRATAALGSETQKGEFKLLLLSLLGDIKSLFIFLFSLLLALMWLNLPDATKAIASKLLIVTLLLQMAFWSTIVVNFIIDIYVKKQLGKEDGEAGKLFGPIRFVMLVMLWAVLLLMILDNLGVNITAFVTGLGIGGIAVALAVQNILGDLFSSLSIVLDKPFEVGDFITIDTLSGRVERVGVKTTRIRSVSGEEIVVSNSDLLKSRIRNFKRMEERRILFRVGVVYESTLSQLESIPVIIKKCIEETPNTKFERAHFAELGAYCLNYEVSCFVESNNYMDYMDTQQAIYMKIFKEFQSEGIAFAYPTQLIHSGANSAK